MTQKTDQTTQNAIDAPAYFIYHIFFMDGDRISYKGLTSNIAEGFLCVGGAGVSVQAVIPIQNIKYYEIVKGE